jgi:hypothetical protein
MITILDSGTYTTSQGPLTPEQRRHLQTRSERINQIRIQLDKANPLRTEANDAQLIMEKAKFRMLDAVDAAKVNPTPYNIIKMRDAGESYENAARKFIAAEFAAEFAENQIRGMSPREAYTVTDLTIHPSIADVKSEVQKAEAARDRVLQEQAAEASRFGPMDTIIAVAEAEAKASILFTIASGKNATAQDGKNLIAALEEAKAANKGLRLEKRDAAMAGLVTELMDMGFTKEDAIKQARRDVAGKLLDQRSSNDWKTGIDKNAGMRRLGNGLVEGRVQEAWKVLPETEKSLSLAEKAYARNEATRNNARLKLTDPSAKLEKTQKEMIAGELDKSLGNHRESWKAVRNLRVGFHKVVLQTKGYNSEEALKIAKDKFKAPENRDKLRVRWSMIREDMILLANFKVPAMEAGKNASKPRQQEAPVYRHDARDRASEESGRRQLDPALVARLAQRGGMVR